MDRGACGLQSTGPQGIRHDFMAKPLPALSPAAWEGHVKSGFVYLLNKHQPHTCCVDRAYGWAFWDLSDEMLAPHLQFLHISISFQLRCHFLSPSCYSNPYCCHSKMHFSSTLSSSRLTGKTMTLLCYELPPRLPPHLKFYLPQSRTAGVILATCPFCTCQSIQHKCCWVLPLDSPQSRTVLWLHHQTNTSLLFGTIY